MRKMVVLLLTLAMSLSFIQGFGIVDVDAYEFETIMGSINLGEEVEVTFAKYAAPKSYLFTPAESGWYKYYAVGDSVAGAVYDSNDEVIDKSNNYSTFVGQTSIFGDFELNCYLEANEEYHLSSNMDYGAEGSYSIGIVKLPIPTDIKLTNSEVYEAGLGDKYKLSMICTPAESIPNSTIWTSSNPDVVEIDENGECFFKEIGNSIVTATTDNGLTDSVEVQVVIKDEIKLNKEEVSFGAGSGALKKYTFIPDADGRYEFSVEANDWRVYLCAYIYDKDYNLISRSGDKWASDDSAIADMYAGEYYYLVYESFEGCIVSNANARITRIGVLSNVDPDGIDYNDELWQAGENLILSGIKELQLNEEKQVNIIYYNARSIHKFTPTESGDYKFIATGNDHVLFSILNDTFSYINSEESPTIMTLEAGETYYITSKILDSADDVFGEYTIEINRLPKAESIEITREEKVVGYIGHKEQLNVAYTPVESESEKLKWTSSDESVVDVDEGYIILKGVGNATVTFTSENGLTDSIEVEVVHYPEIEAGKGVELIADRKETTFTFIPKVSGVYNFSAKAADTEIVLKGNVAKVSEEPFVSVIGKQELSLEYQFSAGEVYYITVETISADMLGDVSYSIDLVNPDYELGDVTKDGEINAEDALMILKAAAKQIKLTTEEIFLGDYNGDSIINAEDALEVLKKVAKVN